MSLAQQLLLRAMVARFWRQPYEARLTRWGTDLHDRFMLPYFVWQDFDDVIEEIAAIRLSGRRGVVCCRTSSSAFRWPASDGASRRHTHAPAGARAVAVLGEEARPAARRATWIRRWSACRSRSTGLTDDRFVLTCNGRPVPLQPTGRNGEYVGGVRYRAWQPASALHPTIGVHAPLTFDSSTPGCERSIARLPLSCDAIRADAVMIGFR